MPIVTHPTIETSSLYKPKVSLRRLPLWGEQVPLDEVDFEWPSLDAISKLPSYVSLKSITLKKGTENHDSGNYPLYFA